MIVSHAITLRQLDTIKVVNVDEIMIFPLGAIVLPEGRMRLKIVEPRYQRMVTECCKYDSGFGVCLFDRSEQGLESMIGRCGTYVRIVDFNPLKAGLFDITVVGVKRFKIIRVREDADHLREASVEWLPNWEFVKMDDEHQILADKLQDIYLHFPELGGLYQERFYDDLSWVSQRWLEILPLSTQLFDDLVDDYQCQKTLDFISKTIRYVEV